MDITNPEVVVDFSTLGKRERYKIKFTDMDISSTTVNMIIKNNGEIVDLSNHTVIIKIQVSDFNIEDVVNILDAINGKIQYTFPSNSLVAGVNHFEIVIGDKENTWVKVSPKIYYKVYDAIGNTIIDENDNFPILIELINNTEQLQKETTELRDITNDLMIEVQDFLDTSNEQELIRQSNENDRINNENQRKEYEEQRISQENLRISKENERQELELLRITEEEQRISQENLRISKENERQELELLRITEEEQRKIAENQRNENEVSRGIEENQRIDNERVRQSNENDRISKNTVYELQENIREENEQIRIENELNRQESFIDKINIIENKIQILSQLKTELEEAENNREDLENQRIDNEEVRIENELNRINVFDQLKVEIDTLINDMTAFNEQARLDEEQRISNENYREVNFEDKMREIDEKIIDVENRMSYIENKFQDLIIGTGFVEMDYLTERYYNKEEIDNNHYTKQVIDEKIENTSSFEITDDINIDNRKENRIYFVVIN